MKLALMISPFRMVISPRVLRRAIIGRATSPGIDRLRGPTNWLPVCLRQWVLNRDLARHAAGAATTSHGLGSCAFQPETFFRCRELPKGVGHA
jgi:hypothetical protein